MCNTCVPGLHAEFRRGHGVPSSQRWVFPASCGGREIGSSTRAAMLLIIEPSFQHLCYFLFKSSLLDFVPLMMGHLIEITEMIFNDSKVMGK